MSSKEDKVYFRLITANYSQLINSSNFTFKAFASLHKVSILGSLSPFSVGLMALLLTPDISDSLRTDKPCFSRSCQRFILIFISTIRYSYCFLIQYLTNYNKIFFNHQVIIYWLIFNNPISRRCCYFKFVIFLIHDKF